MFLLNLVDNFQTLDLLKDNNNIIFIENTDELQVQFLEYNDEILINKNLHKKPHSNLTNHYTRPSFPYLQFEEPKRQQTAFNEDRLLKLNIERRTEHQIISMLEEMMMASTAYKAKGIGNYNIAFI